MKRGIGILAAVALGAGMAAGCPSDDGNDSEGDAGDAGGGSTGTATATATMTDSGTSGGESQTASQSGGSGMASTGNDSATGGDTDGGDDASLPFSCQGFQAPTDDGGDGVVCFYDVEDPEGEPAASLQLFEVDLDGQPSVYVQLIFAPWFVDNTYGAEAIGWDGGHTFKDLDGSDHALIPIGNTGEADPLLVVQLDYIDEDDTAPSAYRALGVWGGEGKMEAGEIDWVLAANSSLSRNLNERGYATYTEDSPATDANYTPNPAAPNWDYRVVYEVWIDASIFTDTSMVEACIESIHASPAKIGDNTVEVFPAECPPGWGCFTTGDCDECIEDEDPDTPSTCDPGDGYPPVP